MSMSLWEFIYIQAQAHKDIYFLIIRQGNPFKVYVFFLYGKEGQAYHSLLWHGQMVMPHLHYGKERQACRPLY